MKSILKSLVGLFIVSSVIMSCQESIQERAEREAREFTADQCPTPFNGGYSIDSIVYNPKTNFHTTYLKIDDAGIPEDTIKARLVATNAREKYRVQMMSDEGRRRYIEAGFNFAVVMRSKTNSGKELIRLEYKNKELR